MLRPRHLKYFIILLLFHAGQVIAQPISRYNTFSYSVNEGLLQTTIADMAFDKNNFCWISFPNGIQKFDGNNFTNIPVQPGLPDDKAVLFFRCRNGDLLISHSEGISKYDITNNKFLYIYKQSASLQKPVIFIGQDGDTIYFYDENSTITGISSINFKSVTTVKTGFPGYAFNSNNRPRFSDNIINHKVALNFNFTLYLWDLQKGKSAGQSPPLPVFSYYLLRLKNEKEVLYNDYKTNNALQCWNFLTNSDTTLTIKGKNNRSISRCIIYPWRDKQLISLANQLFETDTTLQELKSELVNFKNEPVAGNLVIAAIKEDNFGNLYLQTVLGGIKKIIRNNYPVKYYGTGLPKENNILCILPDKENNRVLTGGTGGLFVFDTLQRLIKHIKTLPGMTIPFITNGIIKTNKNDYLLFVNSEKKGWLLSYDLSRLKPIPFSSRLSAEKSGVQYFGNILSRNEDGAIMQSQQNIYAVTFSNNGVSEHRFSGEYIMGGLWYDNMIISHGNNELIFLNGQTFKELRKIPFKNTGGVRCFTKDKAGYIFIGSNKGIFKTDTGGKIIQQWNKETGLPDECIYAMVFDNNGYLWCSSNKGIFRLKGTNEVLQLTKEDGLQENEFNTNTVAKADDGEIFFGGVNGVSSFYPKDIRRYDEKINLLFTQIKVNNEPVVKDTAMWAIDKIVLPYQKGSLSFDFIAMASGNPDQYIYQYKMKGLDKDWIQNSGTQTVRYFLQPGTYTFQIYASRQFDANATPLKEITIIIKSPFWKTWWFITIAALAFITLLVYFINENNKKKYAKKLQVLENERQLKTERERISKDLHDNLGAYANAVLYNIELLEKEKTEAKRNDLIDDLKFASKDIITSLRETVWALKKEKYTAEECFVRIRNFIQPLTRYYSHIHFKTEGEPSPTMELPYTKALNLVRIVQEAVSNSIKHADPGNIIITSFFTDNRWGIKVVDDGKGFDYLKAKQMEQGNGLNNMQQRAPESGFEFKTESSESNCR